MKQKPLKIILGAIITSFLIIVASCQQVPTSQNIIIRSAYNTGWVEELFQTEIVNIGLEKLGYKVEKPKQSDYPIIYVSVANGDNESQII